jgi:hypothetical protein
MTADAQAPDVTDDEIRDWARSTKRKVGDRGRVPDALRAEYMTVLASLGDPAAPAAPDDPAPRGPERPAKPSAARGETTPRKVAPPPGPGVLGRARQWLNGATTTTTTTPAGKQVKTTTPKPAAPARPRTPITRLIESAWGEAAGVMEHVNIPVARTMAWQAPYVGIVTDSVLHGTPVDRLLQPIARAQTSLQGLGAMVAMPVVVGLMTAQANDPGRHGVAAVARQQIYERILASSIDAQLDMFGSPELAAKIRRSAEERENRQAELNEIAAMIFSAVPAAVELAEDASPEQVAEAQAVSEAEAKREAELRAAVAAIRYMAVPAGPDLRGQAAVAQAAAMGQSGQAAADAEAAALGAHLDGRAR